MRNELIISKLGTPVMNHVLVSIVDNSTEFKTEGGIDVRSDYASDAWSDAKGFNISEFMPRSGVVVALPSVLSDYGYDYIPDMELQVGDTVFWNLMSCREMQILNLNGKLYGLVVYQELLIRVREDIILPINGQVLLSAVSKETKAMAYSVVKPFSDVWKIEMMPEQLPVSHIERRNCHVGWEKNDFVKILVNESPYRIEGQINKSLSSELFCVPEHMILATVKDPTI